MLAVIPSSVGFDPLLAIAREQPDRLVQLSYLLFKSKGPTDPLFAQLKAGDDKELARLAELLELHIRQIEQARAEEAARSGGAASIRDPNAPAVAPISPTSPLLKP